MMPRTSRRIPRHLKRNALGSPPQRKAAKEPSPPLFLEMSPLELFFPIPDSLLHPQQQPTRRSTNKKHVSFRPMVDIMEIPSHRTYPPELKQSIWTSFGAVQEMAERNALQVVMEEVEAEDSSSWTEEEDYEDFDITNV